MSIKVLTTKDKDLLKQLSNTGIITLGQVQTYKPLNLSRIKNLVKAGLLEQKTFLNGKVLEKVYSLGNKGKEYIHNTGNMLYRSSSVTHDSKLTDIYYSMPKEYRDSWKHEGELIKEYGEGVDATVCIGGVIEGIEVVTKHYTQEQIKERVDFAANREIKLNIYKI